MTRAVVFAYHDVGVRCLSVLLAHGVEVPLVVTHEDHPAERIWFESVAELAGSHRIPVAISADPNTSELAERIRFLQPEFMFSFYYRAMLKPTLLEMAPRGAFNMHGSLLPKYRGRSPVNWAVLHGERETGATLHVMAEKPDSGPIVDQQAVPILPNDTAVEVFRKVVVAAEIVLDRSLDVLIAGRAPLVPQDLAQGSYFGGRKPENGLIDWTQGATAVHNLIRAVAPPFPGAFCFIRHGRLRLLRTLLTGEHSETIGRPALFVHDAQLLLRCNDGGLLKVLNAEIDGVRLSVGTLHERFGAGTVFLTDPA